MVEVLEYSFVEGGATVVELNKSINESYLLGVDEMEIRIGFGAEDMNGTKIYSGDILENDRTKTKHIVVDSDGGQVLSSFEDEFFEGKIYFWEAVADMQTNSYIRENLVIIGNKYENPNLLNRNRHGI